ncbi:unnamed protein product [Caenorhabditis brenneri]
MLCRSKMANNHTSMIFTLLLSILIINIMSYFTVFKLEKQFEAYESVDIYNPNSLKDLRLQYAMNAEKYARALFWASRRDDGAAFYKTVKLEAYCSGRERIGDIDDGGKYVCMPKNVRKENCTLLSLGLNNQITYDLHITNITGGHCTILGADKDPQSPKTQELYSNINGKLFVGMIPNEITINSMMQKAGRKDVDIMKIDIEEGEIKGLEPFIKEYSVCQILIELHGPPKVHLEMLQKMAKYNFRIFNVDPNPYCPGCCEYSMINENCMNQYGVVPLAVTVPISEY